MTIVDLCFPVHGTEIPEDHGYALYGAVSRAIPETHEAEWLAIHPFSGRKLGNGCLAIGTNASLRLRLPASHIGLVLPLAGKELVVAGKRFSLGAPRVDALTPAESLDARTVVVKLTKIPRTEAHSGARQAWDRDAIAERVRDELKRQLRILHIDRDPELCGRRQVAVGGRKVIGFSVRVSGLDAEQSLALQSFGLGGKRRMGCGIFRPTRGA